VLERVPERRRLFERDGTTDVSPARLRLLGGLLLALLVGGSPGPAAAAAAPPPVMAVVPTCGPPAGNTADVVPYSIEVVARNLGIYGVYVVFNPGTKQQVFPEQPDETGSLLQVVRVAPVPAGTYTIEVQDLDHVTMASARFLVPCPAPPPSPSPSPSPPPSRFTPPPSVLNPTLTLTPVVGPPGTIVTVRGADFPPGTQVQVSWSEGIVSTAAAPITTDSSGAFTTTVLVFPHDTLGARVMTAVTLITPRSSLFGFASAPFLVVPGEVQPSDFAWRR
jgi:hypothetical protein